MESSFSVKGPQPSLDSEATRHIALVPHELAANAFKDGALTVPEGKVAVGWELLRGGRWP